MLKTTSGSPRRTDLSNIMTLNLSQTHTTVPLKKEIVVTTTDNVTSFMV
jgi:hypothetical protein